VAELRAGERFAGYEIEGIVARGGMGVVYRGRQLRPDRVVALKVIAADVADDPEFRERFERESQLAAAIEHPNVIPVYEVGEHRGVLFLAMRYVDGPDLRSVVERQGALDPQRAVRVVSQVAAALDAAHRSGLVHRDVKPANVLLAGSQEDEHAYLTDFGLGKRIGSETGLTRSGAYVGTVDFVAPEQISEGRADARSDVYGLGCLLFTIATGEVPFPGRNFAATLFAHVAEPPPRPSSIAPSLPRTLDAVVARALAKSPEQRYPSAGDLGRAAAAAVRGETVQRAEASVARGRAASTSDLPATWPHAQADTVRAGERETVVARWKRRLARRAALIAVAMAALTAIAFAGLLAGGSGDGDGVSEEDVRSLLDSYSARYTALDLRGLAELFAPDFQRKLAADPPQDRAEALRSIRQQLRRVVEPRYTLEDVRIQKLDGTALVNARYVVRDRSSPSSVLGVVGTGDLTFRIGPVGGRPRIRAVHVVPDLLVLWNAPPRTTPSTLTVIARTLPPAGGRPVTLTRGSFRLTREGLAGFPMPLSEAGREALKSGTRLRVTYVQSRRGRRAIRAERTATFTRSAFFFD
jgi:serine/threonine-protein kinase